MSNEFGEEMSENYNPSCTRKIKTPCGNLYVMVTIEDGKPKMAGLKMGKAGGCVALQMEMTSRLITMLFEYGTTVNEIAKELRGIDCHLGSKYQLSCANAIAQAFNTIPIEGVQEYERKMQDSIEQQPSGASEPPELESGNIATSAAGTTVTQPVVSGPQPATSTGEDDKSSS